MKPRVAVIAKRPSTSRFLTREVEVLFADMVEFISYATDLGLEALTGVDLVLVSSLDMTREIMPFVQPGTEILVLRRTLSRKSWEQVMALPARTRAMLVNDDPTAAMETIALLHELGAKHLDLVPYYPGLEPIPDAPLAITPGEREFVPPTVEKVIDIGPRLPDVGALADMLSKLGLFSVRADDLLSEYVARTVPRSPSLCQVLSAIVALKRQMELILDIVDEGVIAFDQEGRLTMVNHKAEELLLLKPWKDVGQPLDNLLAQPGLTSVLASGVSVYDEFRCIRGRDVLVNRAAIRDGERIAGGVITFKEVREIQRLQSRLRQELQSRGHAAKYTFRDLVGKSRTFKETITRALQMAHADAAILIQGESGTGKELFAQAIHSASSRADCPFVAVNCAAVPENLLESELFGYEEGAFTGARRGGKAGLFEQAHRGTIFLDEIGEMPLNLQARMLRVLQEKEVMRIGGTRVIPINVRVIAATNQNVTDLVRRGTLRTDLFYRLNVLPLQVPPLRERKEDIPLLVEHFLGRSGRRVRLLPESLDMLCQYDWPGNVRELENCLEYMTAVSGEQLRAEDVPASIRAVVGGSYPSPAQFPPAPGAGPEDAFGVLEAIGRRAELLFILKELHRAQQLGLRIGRRTLATRARQQGLNLSEQRIRSCLAKLGRAGFARVLGGRAGTCLTPRGEAVLNRLAP